jgi:DNA (cytosine-5)-methyltransferase 1
MTTLNVVSLFAGAGGLDLGFSRAGFQIIYANEYDKDIWDTYRFNHPNTPLDTRSLVKVSENDIPECDGIIGGPPCQSWSEGGSRRGINDHRGQLFFEFIRVLRAKKPKFFLAENVSGMLAPRHREALENIKQTFADSGYDVFFKLLNAAHYGVAQDRERVIFVGFRKDLGIHYTFPTPHDERQYLRHVINDLADSAQPAQNKSKPNSNLEIANHEYMTGGFSSIYMSRNRVRAWDEPSFTIQAGGRHAPIHPSAPKMEKLQQDAFRFVPDQAYRRLSVRECARIQGFPDDFVFLYNDLNQGYKMIGNAVAVKFAQALAASIHAQLAHIAHKTTDQPRTQVVLTDHANVVAPSTKQTDCQLALW